MKLPALKNWWLVLLVILFLAFDLWFFLRSWPLLPFLSGSKIAFHSEVGGFELKSQNLSVLEKYLQQLAFFGQERVTPRLVEPQKVTVEKLMIVLTDQDYRSNRFGLTATDFLAANEDHFEDGLLILRIGLNRSLLGDQSKAQKWLDTQLLLAAYELIHPGSLEVSPATRETLPKLLVETADKLQDQNIFVIQRK